MEICFLNFHWLQSVRGRCHGSSVSVTASSRQHTHTHAAPASSAAAPKSRTSRISFENCRQSWVVCTSNHNCWANILMQSAVGGYTTTEGGAEKGKTLSSYFCVAFPAHWIKINKWVYHWMFEINSMPLKTCKIVHRPIFHHSFSCTEGCGAARSHSSCLGVNKR